MSSRTAMSKRLLGMCLLLLYVQTTFQFCEENRRTIKIDTSNGTCSKYDHRQRLLEYNDYDSDTDMDYTDSDEDLRCASRNRYQEQTSLNTITCYNETPDQIKTASTVQENTYPIELVLKNVSIPELSTPLSVLVEWDVVKIELIQLNITKIAPKYFHNIENLTDLRLNDNNLTEVSDDVFSSISSLNYLSLARNQIKSLSENAFKDSRNLSMLDLRQNQISTLPDRIFEHLHELSALELSNNKLVGEIDLRLLPTTNLYRIDLSGNQITTLRGLNITSDLAILLISHNNLTVLQNMGQVYKLNASYNRIERLDKDVLHPRLAEIDLSHNSIVELSDEAFSNLDMLTNLHLHHNRLSKLPISCFKDLTSLEYLDLSNNDLVQIPYGLFTNLKHLVYLDISNNNLELEIERLFVLKSLNILKFSHNRIKHINAEALIDNLPDLRAVSLENNFWTCKELTELHNAFNRRVSNLPHYYHRYLKRIEILEGSTYDQENVNGIACKSDSDYTENVKHEEENKLITYFDNFNNTNLFRYIESLTLNQNSATESLKKFLEHDIKNTSFYRILQESAKSDVKENCRCEERKSNVYSIFACIILVLILCILVLQMFIIRKSCSNLTRKQVGLSYLNLLSENSDYNKL